MKQIYLYGDSNTYGYVFRGLSGDRYPEEVRWPGRVRKSLGDNIGLVEDGLNGRPLPSLPRDERKLRSILAALSAGDLLVVMLGTNDIALSFPPEAETAVGKMEDLLIWLKAHAQGIEVLVIAPPCPRVEYPIYTQVAVQMNEDFQSLCKEYGFLFENAESWNIDLSADGIHFSEDGHRQFATNFLKTLQSSGFICEVS